MKKLAFLGLSAGVLLTNQSPLEADAINLDYVIAKPSCSAHSGCGGLTAAREVENTKYDVEEELEDDSKQKRFDEEDEK